MGQQWAMGGYCVPLPSWTWYSSTKSSNFLGGNITRNNKQASMGHHQASSWPRVCWLWEWLWPRIAFRWKHVQKLVRTLTMSFWRCPASSGALSIFSEENQKCLRWAGCLDCTGLSIKGQTTTDLVPVISGYMSVGVGRESSLAVYFLLTVNVHKATDTYTHNSLLFYEVP